MKKQIRREKHPGKDDVHFLYLASGRTLHVDGSVYVAVRVSESLRKKAWSRELYHDDHVTQLTWSSDFYGMARAMPAIVVVMIITALIAHIVSRRALRQAK